MSSVAQRPPRVQTVVDGKPIRWLTFPPAYLFRYGNVVVATLVLFACEAVVLAQRGMQWRGDIVWTIDWIPVSFIIVGPVIAGFAALDTARTATGAGHMFRNRVHRTPSAAVAVAYVTVLGLAHLVCVTLALVISAPPVLDAGAPVAILVQILMLAFFSCLGTFIGRFATPVMSGLIGAIAALGLMYVASAPDEKLVLLEFGGATIPRIGYAYNTNYLLWQGLALTLACAAFLIPRPLEGRRRNHVSVLDIMASGLLVSAIITISVTASGDRLKSVDSEPSNCGAAATIPTCFYPQHQRVAAAFTDQFWALAESAKEKGYGAILPKMVVEASRTRLPQMVDPLIAPFYVQSDHLQGSTPTLWEIASGIVQPVHCPQVRGDKPPSDKYWEDLGSLTATWVALADPSEAALSGFPSDMAPAQAASLIQEFRSCTYASF